MAAKKKKRAYHHGDLRAALLTAARDELHEVGWRHLSLRSVARRAGVTHTAAYHHFADKSALLASIAAEGFALLDERMAEEMERAGPDPVARLLASGRGYLRMASEDPAAYDLMFNGVALESIELRNVGPRPFERLVHAVGAARAATGRTESNVLDDAFIHWELVHGAATLARAGKWRVMGLDPDTHARAIEEALRQLYPRVSGT